MTTSTDTTGSTEYGMWTDTFTALHQAVTTGAPVQEIRALEAAELDELCRGEAQ